MEAVALKEMKGSNIHRIIAAVLEIVEKVNIQTNVDTKLVPDKDDENIWKMDFTKKETNLEELNTIKKELGNSFSVNISSKDKNVVISIVAPGSEFITLVQKKASDGIPSRDMFDNHSGEQK